MEKELYSNVKSKATPTDKEDIVNKKYVDKKIQTKTWEQYQALSEEDKNGVTFFVPDLPIDASGKVIGDIEYGNFKLDDNYNITSSSEVAVKELIPFKSLLNSEGNMTSNNGLVPLKKGKTYKIVAAIRTGDTSQTDIGYLEFCLYDNKGNLLKQGIANNGLVTRGIYPIVYTITPKEDISVGIYITYRTPPVTVIVGENRSYFNITEIPSYTGLLDCSDDHIKEVANTDRNIKTYNSLSQLGLTAPTTVGDIFNAIPTGSMCRITGSTTENLDYTITDIPAPQGILIIDKIASKSFDIEFKLSTQGSVSGNNKWIGQLKGGDGSGLTWSRLCTTKVSDTDLITSLTYNESAATYYTLTNNGLHSHYIVKNGICYVDIDVTCVSTRTNNWAYVFTGLPIPISEHVRYFSMGGEDGKSNINGIMDIQGRIGLMFGNPGIRYVSSFSYPVSES